MRETLTAGLALMAAMAMCVGGCGRAATPTTSGRVTDGVAAGVAKEADAMLLKSSAFAEGETMPAAFAHAGANQSPPLEWTGAPDGTRSFALACVDRHPVARGWVHWLVIDVPAGTASLAQGASGGGMPSGSRELKTSYGSAGWGGPAPPPGTGPHTYEFTVYALDVASLDVPSAAGLDAVLGAMRGHVLASAKLDGSYGR